MQYDHATWIADVPHGEELPFPWLFPRGVNGLSADRSKRLSVLKYFNQRLYDVDARWRKKKLPTLCLLVITWNKKGYPVKLVYKCVYVRVIT